jgi:hypothetical protein
MFLLVWCCLYNNDVSKYSNRVQTAALLPFNSKLSVFLLADLQQITFHDGKLCFKIMLSLMFLDVFTNHKFCRSWTNS